MNDEPDQAEVSAHSQQVYDLCARLFARHSEPIGIINVREAEQLYERIIGWIAGRYALLEQLMERYRMGDLNGDDQPFVLGQSFAEMISVSSTPTLPSQTAAFPPMSQSISPEAPASKAMNKSAAPPGNSGNESPPPSSTKFRVSRRPPPASDLDQPDDWQSGGAALKSDRRSLEPDEGPSKPIGEGAGSKTTQPSSPHQQALSSSLTAPEMIDRRQPPLPLEMAQDSSPHARPPAEESLGTDESSVKAGSKPQVTDHAEVTDHADAARVVGINNPPPRQLIEEAQTAKRPPVAREINGRAAEASLSHYPLVPKDVSSTQQTSDAQSTPAARSGAATKSHPPKMTADTTGAQQDEENPVQLRPPASSQDSQASRRVAGIERSVSRAEQSGPPEMSLASIPAQAAQRDALTSPPRSQESPGDAAQSGPYIATEMRREPVNSQHVDFVWREGDDAAAELAFRRSGVVTPPSADGLNGPTSTPFSSLPDQRVAPPPAQEQSGQVNLEKIPDHVVNVISQQVIRTLSRILIIERERKGIR